MKLLQTSIEEEFLNHFGTRGTFKVLGLEIAIEMFLNHFGTRGTKDSLLSFTLYY